LDFDLKDSVIKYGKEQGYYDYDSEDEDVDYKDSYMFIYDGMMNNKAVEKYINDILDISTHECDFYVD
jgi:ubiquinone biosynthesis protein COQ9